MQKVVQLSEDDKANDQNDARTNSSAEKIKRPKSPRPFPSATLEKSLSIALAIKEKNAGNPWQPTQVAKALNMGAKSSALDTYARASQLYGLTSGSRQSPAFSLEKLGREIVYAPSPDALIGARRRAFLNVELFAKVLQYYKGNNLPEFEYLSNTLNLEFGLPAEWHQEFRDIFIENCRYCEIGNQWTGLESTPVQQQRTPTAATSPVISSFAASENREGKRCFVIMPFTGVFLTGVPDFCRGLRQPDKTGS